MPWANYRGGAGGFWRRIQPALSVPRLVHPRVPRPIRAQVRSFFGGRGQASARQPVPSTRGPYQAASPNFCVEPDHRGHRQALSRREALILQSLYHPLPAARPLEEWPAPGIGPNRRRNKFARLHLIAAFPPTTINHRSANLRSCEKMGPTLASSGIFPQVFFFNFKRV